MARQLGARARCPAPDFAVVVPPPPPTTTTTTYHCQDARLMSWRERWLWCIGVGAVTSSAISVKWTALATPGEDRAMRFIRLRPASRDVAERRHAYAYVPDLQA